MTFLARMQRLSIIVRTEDYLTHREGGAMVSALVVRARVTKAAKQAMQAANWFRW